MRVDGAKASADVGSEEGLGGQTFTIALVEEDGAWRLDETVLIERGNGRSLM